ncbi:hypothetical protein MMC16_007482 [Acarospora aff. strigata]|nr:hypothetical protein [Acarospora aff. strigata]
MIYSYASFFSASLAVASSLFASVTALDVSSKENLAVYWGQGPNQQRLRHFCDDSSIDIVLIGFVNIFPDQGAGGYPGSNFGNQCGGEYYKTPDNVTSQLLSNCPNIAADIPYCQSRGKKILLSLGGAYPGDYRLNDRSSATNFADFLWGAFGPEKVTWTGPRPFGAAVVDGFDFDIESYISPPPATDYQYANYGTMINRLRTLYALEVTRTFYISGAPQCVVPDAHLADAIKKSWFDFIFVQFYNTPYCAARAYFDETYGGPGSNISFDQWASFVQSSSRNPHAKIYLGLPASTAAASPASMYLSPSEVGELVNAYQCKYPDLFGGIMLWEATYSENNQVNGKSYADNMKDVLVRNSCSAQVTSLTTSVTSSTLSSSSIASSTAVTSPTSVMSTTTTSISSSAAPAQPPVRA